MKKKDILWKQNGWITLQDADAEKHELEISAYADNGVVTGLIIRHNDGENRPGIAYLDDKNILPIALDEFKALFLKDKLLIK